jgi:hypothetical protein
MYQTEQIDGAVLDLFFLARLKRFARLANQPDDATPSELRRLARYATLAAYRDCVARGLGRAARREIASAPRRRPAGRKDARRPTGGL